MDETDPEVVYHCIPVREYEARYGSFKLPDFWITVSLGPLVSSIAYLLGVSIGGAYIIAFMPFLLWFSVFYALAHNAAWEAVDYP